ncbi:MAG: ASC-1-like (ASCH) protein [Myxococcota bacterium]|jgi:ASC-1-like (ASCH) protein
MATFDASTHALAFAHMEGGVKTVFVVPRTLELSVMSSGDRLEFEGLGSITVGMVRHYETLELMLTGEGWANVVPEADSEEHAAELLRASPDWDARAEAADGVLALRVRWAKRKV